ncbi:MAG: hypothetical protein MUO40_14755 [Anaerolineaceae bacterium]|nr:hypothetical protein [Anaerolineaceae bacterium]
MKKTNLLIIICTLIIVFALSVTTEAVQASVIPTFGIVTVEKDKNVTIYTKNFPADKTFKVLMGEYGTKGVGGIEVTTINSGTGGSFYGTFLIPPSLYGRAQIAIRLQGVDTPYYAYNWFYNNTQGGSDGGIPGYTGIPTFIIESVIVDTSVTIKTNNFPENLNFIVLMGAYGTKGIGGVLISTINSGAGGSFTETFNVPAIFLGDQRIAIRLESTSGYYAYNWFYNNTSTSPVVPPPVIPGYSGIPTFSITSVNEDNTVTIQTNNFPPNLDFKVFMGKMWTQAIGGVIVTTTNSGTGGTFTSTYTIPASLYGNDRIAIRLEATTGGFFAYNWFWNSTYP